MANKILVVEDEGNTRKTLTKILEKKGYAVISVGDGEECLEKAIEEKPDLILLDVLLPGQSGFGVCEALKNNVVTKDIPIIMVTGLIGDSARDAGLAKGAKYLISKPYDPEDLLWEIENALKTSKEA